MGSLSTLKNWIEESRAIVFFGGAGVSTESGLKDFRSQDGLYHEKYDYPPETILSHSFFFAHTAEFYRFYRDKMLCLTAQPNPAPAVSPPAWVDGRRCFSPVVLTPLWPAI